MRLKSVTDICSIEQQR